MAARKKFVSDAINTDYGWKVCLSLLARASKNKNIEDLSIKCREAQGYIATHNRDLNTTAISRRKILLKYQRQLLEELFHLPKNSKTFATIQFFKNEIENNLKLILQFEENNQLNSELSKDLHRWSHRIQIYHSTKASGPPKHSPEAKSAHFPISDKKAPEKQKPQPPELIDTTSNTSTQCSSTSLSSELNVDISTCTEGMSSTPISSYKVNSSPQEGLASCKTLTTSGEFIVLDIADKPSLQTASVPSEPSPQTATVASEPSLQTATAASEPSPQTATAASEPSLQTATASSEPSPQTATAASEPSLQTATAASEPSLQTASSETEITLAEPLTVNNAFTPTTSSATSGASLLVDITDTGTILKSPVQDPDLQPDLDVYNESKADYQAVSSSDSPTPKDHETPVTQGEGAGRSYSSTVYRSVTLFTTPAQDSFIKKDAGTPLLDSNETTSEKKPSCCLRYFCCCFLSKKAESIVDKTFNKEPPTTQRMN